MTSHVIGAFLAIFMTVPSALDAEARPANLTVRIYNNVGILPHDLRVATSEAEAILQAAGIKVSLVECWHREAEPSTAPPDCRQAPTGRALTLRLPSAASSRSTKMVSMGYSLVQVGDAAPFLATVYTDRVMTVARDAEVDPHRLLGRAIAHEIGHLLLNTTHHANGGLMRERWTRDELRKNDPLDWEFRDQDTRVMRGAVSARLGEAAR